MQTFDSGESIYRLTAKGGVCLFSPAKTLHKTTSAPSAEDAEAHRIAGELVKMHRDGVLSEKDRLFFAGIIGHFGLTYLGKTKETNATGPCVPSEAQRVHIPNGLSYQERKRFLQDDLDEAIGE